MKKKLKYWLLMSMFCFVYHQGLSQVMVNFTRNYDNQLDLQNIWNFSLNNLSGNTINSYVLITVTNGLNEPVVTIQSPKFDLINGSTTTLNNEIIKNPRIEYHKCNEAAIIRKQGSFPSGLYYICVSLKQTGSEAELGENCTQTTTVSLEKAPAEQADSNKKNNFFNKNVKLSGYSELTGIYSNMQTVGSLVPSSYLQWYFNPTVSVFDFPVSIQLLLSTRQNDQQQNINSFNIQFDAGQFMNILRQRALEFIKQKLNNDKLNNLNFESLTGQLGDLKSKLDNPGTLSEMIQIKQLDSLKQSLSDLENIGKDTSGIWDKFSQLKKLTHTDSIQLDSNRGRSIIDTFINQGDSLLNAKKDSLKKKIKFLSWLEDKKPYYDKLVKQKEEIESRIKSINMDSLNGQIDKYKSQYDPQKLSDPKYLYGFMNKFGLFKKFEKLMMSVRKLSVGTSYPNYSDFTSSGIQINGLGIELEKWNCFASFHHGTVLQGIIPVNTQPGNSYVYKRTMTGGSFGYGSKEKTHIHLTLLSFEDDPASIVIPDSMTNISARPQLNQVMDIDMKLQVLKGKLSFWGELAGSQTIRNISLIDSSFMINPTGYHNPREWFANIVLQRNVDLNTSVDFAFKAGMEAVFFKGTTKLSAQVKRVGPGFMSFGNPFMLKDMLNIEGKISQAFWKKRIQISGFIRRNIDNLENTKLLTSQLYNFGFDLGLQIPKWPSLKISMTPYVQSNDSTNMNINVLTANTGYICKIKKMQLMSHLNYMYQDGKSADSVMDFHSHYITLLNTLIIGKKLSFSLTQNYFQINNHYGNTDTYAINFSGSILILKKWNNSIGGTFTVNENERRYGGYYQTSIPFLKYFTMNLRVEYNRYDVIHYTSFNSNIPFDQVYVKGILTTRW